MHDNTSDGDMHQAPKIMELSNVISSKTGTVKLYILLNFAKCTKKVLHICGSVV